MSWWDYGHWITYISERIPNNNPSQHGVAGPNGSAILPHRRPPREGGKPDPPDNIRQPATVITDYQHRHAGTFHAQRRGPDQELQMTPFQPYFLLPYERRLGQVTQAMPFYTRRNHYLTMATAVSSRLSMDPWLIRDLR